MRNKKSVLANCVKKNYKNQTDCEELFEFENSQKEYYVKKVITKLMRSKKILIYFKRFLKIRCEIMSRACTATASVYML